MSRTPTSREGPPSAGAPPPPLHGPGAGLRDGLLAAGIFAFALVLIMGTTRDLGFNRDETFYHHYAKVYGSWLLDLAETRDPAVRERLLSKAEVERVWSQNYEHPPLMKVLFGLSWRIFGEKKREVRFLDRRVLRIQGLDRPHGFDEGDQVDILRPLTVGEEHDAADRVAGTATITRRTRGEAMATILEWRPEEDPLAICASPPDEGLVPRHMGGCMARTTGSLQILSESDAFRLPGALCGALLVALLYLFALGFTGRGGALVSALALLFVPRAFFHMHLTCFDIPITFFGFATLVAFWKAERGGGLRWALVTAVLWGLALLVKLNAFFLPVTLGLYWLATLRGRLRKIRPLPFSVPAIPPAFFLMALVGPLMLYLLWPVLWYDPVRSFGRYLAFHLGHEHYYQSYFGQALGAPPFPVTFPFVMTLLTVPVPPLALFLTGAVRTALPWRVDPAAAVAVSRRRWFLAVNALFPIGLIALPSTPVFGGVKHWLLTMPF
ncbi:MAG: glycosyltransferase family 39 protein, partial [Deltaproteobacteria bacterium]|nr:glycosyltransferase family 39 protein [Deltaproteobacteria bacterium]